MKWRFFKRLRYRPIGKISAGRLCSCVARQQESSEASVDGPDDEEAEVSNCLQEEEVFDWPATPPDDLEIDTSELFGESDRSASLARTVDHVVEMFSAVRKKREDTNSPLPGGSNWRTIQKLVVHTSQDKSSGDEEAAEEDVEMHISVTVNDSPAFFSADNSLAGSGEDLHINSIQVLEKSPTKNAPENTEFSTLQSTASTAPRRSKSELTLNTEKRASIKTLNVVKSLNNLVFREEEYDFAAV